MLRLARERWELVENVAKPAKVSIFFCRTFFPLVNCFAYDFSKTINSGLTLTMFLLHHLQKLNSSKTPPSKVV